MLADLATWFNSRNARDAAAPPARRDFKATYSTNGLTWHAVYPLDISQTGISVASPSGFGKEELDIKLTLGTRIVDARMQVVKHEGIAIGGRNMHKYSLCFIAMKKDDQEVVLRWLRSGTGPPAATTPGARSTPEAVRMNPEDVARLFPKAVQHRLHDELVKRKRLVVHHGREPLVAYIYHGMTVRAGVPMHSLTIESKLVNAHTHSEQRFRTRFLFDNDAAEIKVLD